MHVAETASERKAIEATRYAALFYTYRNHLVHEFREPGYGIERDDDFAAPYYHSMTSCDRGSSENSWELVFPCRLSRPLPRGPASAG